MTYMLKISYQKNVQVDIQTPAIKINYRKHFHVCFTVLKTNRRMYKKKNKKLKVLFRQKRSRIDVSSCLSNKNNLVPNITFHYKRRDFLKKSPGDQVKLGL